MAIGMVRPVWSEPGDATKARTMLDRVVVAVTKDQAAAMMSFSTGADGFKDGDIYPFCFGLKDGIVMSGQTKGRDIRTFAPSDKGGQRMYDAAQQPEGVVTQVTYLARRPPPAGDTPVTKVSVVRRIGEIACGVGYYP
jgi:hypothetical protein